MPLNMQVGKKMKETTPASANITNNTTQQFQPKLASAKLPADKASATMVPAHLMNQLQSTMGERVVHVHQYFNTYQMQPQGYMGSVITTSQTQPGSALLSSQAPPQSASQ